MCGRYVITSAPEAIRALFRYLEAPDFPPRYNIAPTQPVPIVRLAGGERTFALVRWGLIPSWVKDPRAFSLLINARGETLAGKPAFRNAFRRRRCLFPADGFYEWRADGGRKRPYFIRPRRGGPIAFECDFGFIDADASDAFAEFRDQHVFGLNAGLVMLAFHEFHHVIWGHCLFANASIGAMRLHEVGPIVSHTKDDALLHNLEYMADLGAIDLMVWYVKRRSRLNIKWISRISHVELHRLALVACGLMCAAWYAHDGKHGRDGSHPLPSARFGNLVVHYSTKMIAPKGEEFFKRNIGGPAFYDLVTLGNICPEIQIMVDDVKSLTVNEAHVEDRRNIFNQFRKDTVKYEFLTEHEMRSLP